MQLQIRTAFLRFGNQPMKVMRTIQFNYCVVCVGHMGNVSCVEMNLFERFNRLLNLSVGL